MKAHFSNNDLGWRTLLKYLLHHSPREHDMMFSKGDWPHQEVYFKKEGEDEIVLNGKNYTKFEIGKGFVLHLHHKNGGVREIPLEMRECQYDDFFSFRNFIMEFPYFRATDPNIRLKKIALSRIFFVVLKTDGSTEDFEISEDNFDHARVGYSTGVVNVTLKNTGKTITFKL